MIVHSLVLAIACNISTPQELLESANTLITHQQWAEAAVLLDEYVRSEDEPSPEVMYDLGVAMYNIGEYEPAAKAFDASMASTSDPTLKSYSAFNLGNAVYSQTLESLEGKGTEAPSDEDLILLENAKTQIKQVLESYRTAIKHDPTDLDARANGELAWQMLKQLDEMQEQMEEQQQQQQEQDEQSDQQKDRQKHKDEGESEQDQQDQQKQDGEQSEQDQQDQQKQDGEQSKQDQQDQQKQDGEQSSDEQQQDGEHTDKEKEGNESNEEQQNEETQEEQVTSEGELETKDEEMNEAKGEQSHVKDEGERLSEDEANRLLQLIRDKEQQRRKTLAARKAANRVPVEKDW